MDEKKQEIVAEEQEKRELPGQIYFLLPLLFVRIGIYNFIYGSLFPFWGLVVLSLIMAILMFVPRGWVYVTIWLVYVPIFFLDLYSCSCTLILFVLPFSPLLLLCIVGTIYALASPPVHIYFCGY